MASSAIDMYGDLGYEYDVCDCPNCADARCVCHCHAFEEFDGTASFEKIKSKRGSDRWEK